MTNTKEAAKNDYLDIVNYYREKLTEVLNKKVDFSISFEEPSSQQKSIKVAEEDASDKYRQAGEEKYTTEDLQRCKMGEDILFDPYYATKLINKMRLFNLFKLGSRRIRFEEEQFRK